MDEELRDFLLDLFDSAPASVDEQRAIVRKLVEHLSLTADEMTIMAWDAKGRDASDQERLAAQAWDFSEADGIAARRRLFAGFVTNGDIMDGYGADYKIDFALASGITADAVCAAMLTLRPNSLQSRA